MAPIWTRHHWMKEYNEASKFADDVNGLMSEMITMSGSRLELEHHFTALQRNIRVLKTKLSGLEIQLSGLYGEHTITKEEMKLLKDMLRILRSKTNQMEVALSTSNFPNVDCLIGPEIKPVDPLPSTSGLDKEGTLKLQQQIIREQDDALDELGEIVLSTKHVALAMNEELGLHRRLIDTWDYNAETRTSWIQGIRRRLTILNKRIKSGCCSFLCLLLSFLGLLILIPLVLQLVKDVHRNTTQFGSYLSKISKDPNIHNLISHTKVCFQRYKNHFETKISMIIRYICHLMKQLF